MRVTALTVCESASVHDGLMFSLGSGITRRWAPTLPAPLNLMWTLQLEMALDDLEKDHVVHTLLLAPSAAELVHIVAPVRAVRPPRLEPDEPVLLPVVFDARTITLSEYGRYEISVAIPTSSINTTRLFWVLHPEEMLIPPLN
jgi:hypothetical protein